MMKYGETLDEMLDEAILTGEVPYQANRRAVRAFDVMEDVEKGNAELEVVLNGIDAFINELQGVEDAARLTAKRAATLL